MFQRKHTIAAITALGLALTCLAMPQASLASPGEVKLKARFNDGNVSAKAEHEANTRRNKSTFEGEIKFALPNLGINDATGARGTDLTMNLLRGGSPYATCILDLESLKTRRGVTRVEYKVEVKDRGGFIQAKHGYCDIDLNTTGNQVGVPAVQSTDTFTVLDAAGNTTVIIGTFNIY
jgi:hypothetical protein